MESDIDLLAQLQPPARHHRAHSQPHARRRRGMGREGSTVKGKNTLISGIDHSDPAPEMTYPLLSSLLRRIFSTRSVPGPRNTCLKREKPGL